MTAMNLPPSHALWATILLIAVLHLLPLPANSSPPRVLLFEEKTGRLGSTPPSCHNRCNQCHPCMAVEVPSMPAGDGRQRLVDTVTFPAGFIDSSAQGKRNAFYKPMGWKCRCGNHFFNP